MKTPDGRITEFFEGHPERWCKGAHFKDRMGHPTITIHEFDPKKGHTCCLLGSIMICYGKNLKHDEIYDLTVAALDARQDDRLRFASAVSDFNDGTTFEHMLEFVKELNL